MGRRRKNQPIKNTGPVERRGDLAELQSVLGAVPEADSASDWEEREAIETRPRKKQRRTAALSGKKKPAASQRALADGIHALHSPFQFACVALLLEEVSSEFQTSRQRKATIAAAGARVLIESSTARGTINTPSPDIAEALADLAAWGELRLGPLSISSSGDDLEGCSMDADDPFREDTPSMGKLALSLSDREKPGLKAAAKQHWLTLLGWLLPQSGLDPESDAQGLADDVFPCSPRKGGGHAAAEGPHAFDASEIYAAVKPSGREPELAIALPQLRPTLRGYQRRAAQWMVDRELGTAQQQQQSSGSGSEGGALHPLWREVWCGAVSGRRRSSNGGAGPLQPNRCFYVNRFTGDISLDRIPAPPQPKGGIASDEMGLGKTVELLALILANPYRGPRPSFGTPAACRPPRERIDCTCGSFDLDPRAEAGYTGMWVQCADCLAWQHGKCVGLRRSIEAGAYFCGECLRAKTAVDQGAQQCGTTLVVCPAPILAQWREEIERHTQPGALKVLVYAGQKQPGPGQPQPEVVLPADLAAADLVLTTYDVLREDLNYKADLGDTRGEYSLRRRRRRFEIMATPLTRLRFWRVAVDEAQLVESSTAKATAMALKLQTEHRWCVSGTPLSRGLEDLQGLMAFLQYEPYDSRFWWKRAIQGPYEAGSAAGRARLLALLRPSAGGVLWRSAKADVKDELGIPPQHHHLSSLAFSAIERHFYNRQHQDCVGAARATLSHATLASAQAAAAAMLLETAAANAAAAENEGEEAMLLESRGMVVVEPAAGGGSGGGCDSARGGRFEDRPLTQREEHKLLLPLVRLRQACVHPQIGAGGIRALSHARAPMTMQEVLGVLLEKARVEAEEAQRALLASLNGLAGLLLLQGHAAEAVRAYREVLATVEANRGHVRADKLQQLHALQNLAEALAGPAKGAPGVAPTLRDGSLVQEAAALKDEYVAEAVAKLAAADNELKEVREGAMKAVAEYKQQVGEMESGLEEADKELLLSNWWVDAGALFEEFHGGTASLASHVKTALEERDNFQQGVRRNAASIAGRFRDMAGLQMLLKQALEDQTAARQAAVSQLDALAAEVAAPSTTTVSMAATCQRCRAGDTAVRGHVCRHCRLDEKFSGWDVRVFFLDSIAMEAGAQVTAEEAAMHGYGQTMRHVGRGGLGELAGPQEREGGEDRRAGTNVSATHVIRMPSQAEQALRVMQHQLRVLKLPTDRPPRPEVQQRFETRKKLLLAAAKAHLKVLETARAEVVKARTVALAQRRKLYALDELEMCAMRMTLRAPGQAASATEELFMIYEPEIPVKSTELSADKAVAAAELRRTIGTLRYLQGLKEEQERRAAAAAAAGSPQKLGGAAEAGAASAVDHETCPICQEPLGLELAMLPCGHRLCCRCELALVEQLPAGQSAASKRIACPTCRSRVLLTEIAYVDGKIEDAPPEHVMVVVDPNEAGPSSAAAPELPLDYAALPGESRIKVRGSYGTKLEAVVRRLAALTQRDPHARALVFSSWKDSLELLSHALVENGIKFLFPRGAKQFEPAVAQFRAGHENAGGEGSAQQACVLLMMTRQGGNGLNLQAAQHVLFLEPLLNPAEEAQAVGRVDRIGQTYATHVHRFVVRGSIEENVHRLSQHRAAAMNLSAAAVRRNAGGDKGGLTLRDVAALLQDAKEERGGSGS